VDISTQVTLVEVTDAEFRNPQELASIWGDTGPEVRKLDSSIGIVDTYALLDRCDFLLGFEAPDHDAAFELPLVVEHQRLNMTTMEGVPIEHFAEFADDR